MTQSLHSYYRGKKVFVTGHTGFKGGWLLACLHRLGAKTKGYALEPEYENGIFNIVRREISSESIIADIRDKEKLEIEIRNFQPDFIFHLAAQPLVRRSYAIPAETFDVNVVGTANLLEAVTRYKNKCTVTIVTTDKVYENRKKNDLYRETDRLGGHDPYSASKACTELVIKSYRESFFSAKTFQEHQKALASVRAGNVIGGGDWSEDRIIPDIIRSLKQTKDIPVRNPDSVRPWQHVLEPIIGYLLLANSLDKKPGKFSGAYNFGPLPKDHISVKQLVKLAIKTWGWGHWQDVSKPGQLHEAEILQLDISKAKKQLNWKPRLSSKEAIRWSINWYKQPKEDQLKYTFRQIDEYLAL